MIPEDDDEQQVTNDLDSDVQQVHVLDGENGNQNLADDLGSDDLVSQPELGCEKQMCQVNPHSFKTVSHYQGFCHRNRNFVWLDSTF